LNVNFANNGQATSNTPLYCTTAPADNVKAGSEKYWKSCGIHKKSLNYITPEKAKTFFEFTK
jgi:hypothetical protein